MTSKTPAKKEIRIKVENKFFQLLQENANQYGVKPTDYVVHLILDDIKHADPPHISAESEVSIEESINEIKSTKKDNKLKPKTAKQIMKEIQ